MVKRDAGGRQGLLDRRRDASGVPVSQYRDRTAVVHVDERGTDVPGDRVGVGTLGDLAVLDVPPSRRLGLNVLLLRLFLRRNCREGGGVDGGGYIPDHRERK